jgi:hypothetical protein
MPISVRGTGIRGAPPASIGTSSSQSISLIAAVLADVGAAAGHAG